MYRIVDWDKHFENNRSRGIVHVAWVPMPNSHDGCGYVELLSHEDGAAHFGAWCVIVQVASKCNPRGTLVRSNGKPHDADSISSMTRFPKAIVEAAIQRLIGSIGWMEVIEDSEFTRTPHLPAVTQHDSAGPKHGDADLRAHVRGTEGTERNELNRKNGTESNGSESDAFTKLTEADLRSPELTDDWFRAQAGKKRPVVDQSDSARLRIHGAAEQAIAKGTKTKVGLFVSIVMQGQAAKIDEQFDQLAQKRIRELDAKPIASMTEALNAARLRKAPTA